MTKYSGYTARGRTYFATRRRPKLSTRLLSACLGLVCAALFLGTATVGTTQISFATDDAGYVIGPRDKLRVSVHEWRPARAEVYEWEAVNGEFTVGATGKIALPLVGHIRASGRTTEELGRIIGEKVRERIGLAVTPDSVVEVVEFRPFYILGAVQTPAEYAFRPDLTVMKAIAVAGGLQRSKDVDEVRDMIRIQGQLEGLATRQLALEARASRLQAELEGARELGFPKSNVADRERSAESLLMEDESRLFDARREARETEMRALVQLKTRLTQELSFLNGNIGERERQVTLTADQVKTIDKLYKSGLSTSVRKYQIERVKVQDQADLLDLYAARSRVRQSVAQADLSLVQLRNKWKTEVSAELAQTRTELSQVNSQIAAGERELAQLRRLSPGSDTSGLHVVYTITRETPHGVQRIAAADGTQVLPGDTIHVDVESKESSFLVGGKDDEKNRGVAFLKGDSQGTAAPR